MGATSGPSRRFFGPVQGLYDFRQPTFSPDGRMLALAVDPTAAVIASADLGLERQRLRGHQGFISVTAWDSKGERLATGSSDETIKLWNVSDGSLITTISTLGSIFGLCWDNAGQRIAAVHWPSDGTRRVGSWDLESRKRVFTADTPGGTYRPNVRQSDLRFSPDGARLAAETNDGVTVWETATARPIFQVRTGPRFAQLAGCDPGVKRWASLETVGSRATCRVIDMDTSEELMNVDVEIPMNRYQSALAWSPDGRHLAAGFSQGKVFVYAVAADRSANRTTNCGPAEFFKWSPTGKQFAFKTGAQVSLGQVPKGLLAPKLVGASIFLPDVLSLSPDARLLAGSDRDGTLPIWNIDSGEIVKRLPGHPRQIKSAHGENEAVVNAVVWSPDGKRLASLRHGDGSVLVWDIESATTQTIIRFGSRELPALQNAPPPLTWSGDGRLVAVRSGWPARKIRICDASTGRQVREWDGGDDLASSNAMAWDTTSTRLATCFGTPPRIQIKDVSTGETVLTVDDQITFLRRMSFSPDGLRLAYLLQNDWRVCELATGRRTPIEGTGERLLWKPDGSELALLGSGPSINGALGFYDATTGKAARGVRGFDRPDAGALRLPPGANDAFNLHIQSVVWTNTRFLAAGDGSPYPGTGIRVVWDISTGKPLWKLGQLFEAPENRPRVARSVAWSPDGRSLATLSGDTLDDCRIEVWDALTLGKTHSFIGSRISFRNSAGLAWSPDGKSLACAAGAIKVWKLAAPGRQFRWRNPQEPATRRNRPFWRGAQTE